MSFSPAVEGNSSSLDPLAGFEGPLRQGNETGKGRKGKEMKEMKGTAETGGNYSLLRNKCLVVILASISSSHI